MNYWLMKSEPDVFGIDDLERVQVEPWDGVRNYQARNMMRDQMQRDDLAFLYHSNTEEPGIVGIMRIAREGYPDAAAFDPEHKYFDPKSDPQDPRWFRVDVAFEERFERVVSLAWLREQPEMAESPLVRKGNRLSVLPVTPREWDFVMSHVKRRESSR